jgi:hypothetical protein
MKRYSKLSLRSLGWGLSLALTDGFVRTAAADVKLPAIFTSHISALVKIGRTWPTA